MARWVRLRSPAYFYPRPPRGGRRSVDSLLSHHDPISIHALREEGDRRRNAGLAVVIDFYPRPPRGGRLFCVPRSCASMTFLSTPSARRATSRQDRRIALLEDFYPRPPRGGRLSGRVSPSGSLIFLSTPSARRATSRRQVLSHLRLISIHALREEGDHGAFSYLRSPL